MLSQAHRAHAHRQYEMSMGTYTQSHALGGCSQKEQFLNLIGVTL
ncbi:MAG: hypothetical protein AB7D28_08070 [Candidatus Berkiella sp.]